MLLFNLDTKFQIHYLGSVDTMILLDTIRFCHLHHKCSPTSNNRFFFPVKSCQLLHKTNKVKSLDSVSQCNIVNIYAFVMPGFHPDYLSWDKSNIYFRAQMLDLTPKFPDFLNIYFGKIKCVCNLSKPLEEMTCA